MTRRKTHAPLNVLLNNRLVGRLQKETSGASYDQWFPDTVEFHAAANFHSERGNAKLTAFNLHQAAERLYHCVLLVLTLYSPESHRITMLRSEAEALDDRLKAVCPTIPNCTDKPLTASAGRT